MVRVALISVVRPDGVGVRGAESQTCYRFALPVLNVLSVTLALNQPVEVFEEWALIPSAPLAESVIARGVYLRREGSTALLPLAVQGVERPVVHALGHDAALAVSVGPRGWQCALPPGERDSVRLIAHVVRPVEAPRLFRMRWPRVRESHVPARRVAIVPRDWIESVSRHWTCPAEAPEEVPCVTREARPSPLTLRVTAARSPRGSFLAALALTSLALGSIARASPSGRAERVTAALGGVVTALALGLSLVGAHVASWGGALVALVPAGALVGAAAPRKRLSRVAATVALVVLPLLAVFGASASAVLACAVLFALVTLGGALRPG